MAGPRIFTSFDFDHDEDIRLLFVGQARNPRTPFTLADWSVKAPMSGDWKEQVRSRIRSVDRVVVLCGEHMDTATGVSAEVRIAREEGKPVYFIKGRKDKNCKLPKAALPTDRMADWTWDGLAVMLRKPTPHPEIPQRRIEPIAPYSPPLPRHFGPPPPRERRAPIIRPPRMRTRTMPRLTIRARTIRPLIMRPLVIRPRTMRALTIRPRRIR